MDWQASNAFKKGKKGQFKKKKKKKSDKVISNALIMISRDIIPGIATRNQSKTEKLERKPKS
jgi:hypothetical protein